MDNQILIDKSLARVLDLLDQIKKLNKMIALHKQQSKDKFMANQYIDMKNRFLLELKDILSDYEIDILIKDKAA